MSVWHCIFAHNFKKNIVHNSRISHYVISEFNPVMHFHHFLFFVLLITPKHARTVAHTDIIFVAIFCIIQSPP